jgi:putative FmdB family regulatory protein
MPLYEFKCKSCGKKFEELLFSTIADPGKIFCPACGKNDSERLMSAFSSSGSESRGISSLSGCGSSGFS